MPNLYTFDINIDTLEISSYTHEDDNDYDEESTDFAKFNEDGFRNIYAESLVSMKEAELLVWEKAREYRDKFADVSKTLAARNLKAES